MGPMFRHERPQKGRYRQFHQVGVEALGLTGPDIDAEQILMCARLWDDLGLNSAGSIKLEINSLGQTEERARHRTDLIAFLGRHVDLLDADGKRRLQSNPLRILDTKNPALQGIVEAAPKLIDYLGEASLKHFEGVQQYLKDAALPYRINPRLVRGLDYYNLTVFEWVTEALGAQGTVCAGGRYDGLIEQLGGKPAPACGFAMGVERLMALLDAQGGGIETPAPDIYLVHQGQSDEASQRLAFRTAEMLRGIGCSVLMHMGGGSFKAQFKRADASGAQLAIVIGADEAAAQAVALKPLRIEGEQETIPLEELADRVDAWLYGDDEQLDED
jgi:histidyl-tRNA synthetase